jgi:hypothetical protein
MARIYQSAVLKNERAILSEFKAVRDECSALNLVLVPDWNEFENADSRSTSEQRYSFAEIASLLEHDDIPSE